LIASEVLKLPSSLVGHNSKRKAPYSHLSTEELTELAMFVVEAIYATMGMGWKEGAAMGCILCQALQHGMRYEEFQTKPVIHGGRLCHMKDCPRSGLNERCDDDGNFICQVRCSEIPDLQARVDAIYRTMTETTLERLMRSAEVMRSSKKTKKRKSG